MNEEVFLIEKGWVLRAADRFVRSIGPEFRNGTFEIDPDECPVEIDRPIRLRASFAYPGVLLVSLASSGAVIAQSLPGSPLEPDPSCLRKGRPSLSVYRGGLS